MGLRIALWVKAESEGVMLAYILFSGTGPILVLTTYPELTDERLLEKLSH